MFKKIIVFTFVFVALTLLAAHKIHASVTTEYPLYNVDIQVNKDASFIVTEKILYNLTGEAHGVRRDLTLNNDNLKQQCQRTGQTCGGFDRLDVISVTDFDGKDLTSSGEYSLYNVDNGDTRSLRFELELWPDGKDVTDFQVGWILKYKVYGGIQAVNNVPYFYWNMIPEDRGGPVSQSTITLTLPSGTTFSKSGLDVYTDFQYTQSLNSNSASFILKNLYSAYGDFTVSYSFAKDDLVLPGNITYNITSPTFGADVYLDDIKQSTTDSVIKSIPVGEHTVSFRHVGYVTDNEKVTIKSGETINLNVDLKPEPWMQILLIINYGICLLACCAIPLGFLVVYLLFQKRGKDQQMPKIIIPLFSPPEGTNPYLVGSLIDEQVDKRDVVAEIINLAYLGYIKIKELNEPGIFSQGNYEITSTGKDTRELDDIQKKTLNYVMNGQETRETKEMGTYFYTKYLLLVSEINNLMVSKGFFKRKPAETIGMYAGAGVVSLALGVIGTIFISTALSVFLGSLSVFGPTVFLIFLGLGLIVVAKYMPAKTSLGSKVLADILGFKMYLYTAERFTLANLKPEFFEKYLPYAVALGVEKEWAKKFEGIYNGNPSWYEGTSNVYDSIWIGNFVSNFSNSTTAHITPVTTSSSGGGWSSGGSFGGFSGGGGGGGSSGGW